MSPLISIIIPTYNRSHLISETLDSIISQTYTNWECIIVNDGSTDDTEKIVKKYIKQDNRFQFHNRPKHLLKGGNAARNYGFDLSKGEFINWFDDDDKMEKDFLLTKISSFDENIDIVIAPGYFCDAKLNIINEMKFQSSGDLFVDFLLWKLQIITNSVMIRKEFLKDRKLFEEWIVRGQETEFFSRLFFNIDNSKVRIINSCQFFHRNHLDRKTSKDNKYIFENQKCTGYIYLSNYSRVVDQKNEMLMALFYNRIIALWFRHLKFEDFVNLRNLENQFLLRLRRDKINFFKIKLAFFLCRKFNIQSTKFKNFLKKKYGSDS